MLELLLLMVDIMLSIVFGGLYLMDVVVNHVLRCLYMRVNGREQWFQMVVIMQRLQSSGILRVLIGIVVTKTTFQIHGGV